MNPFARPFTPALCAVAATLALSAAPARAEEKAPARGRFIEVLKNDISSNANTRLFHIAEIEVFAFGTVPDGADPDGTSTNDLVQAGAPTAAPGTTTTLTHGLPGSVFDGDIEEGTDVWTTADAPVENPRFILDLGASHDIGTVRLFNSTDPETLPRLNNFTVSLYADDGTGARGALVSSATFGRSAPIPENGSAEIDLALADPSITSFASTPTQVPPGHPVTLTWAVSPAVTSLSVDQGVGDVTAMAGDTTLDPGPTTTTTYTITAGRPGCTSTQVATVGVTGRPLIYSLAATSGPAAPGSPVTLSWDTAGADTLELDGNDVTGSTTATVTPAAGTTYTLTASNATGSTSTAVRIYPSAAGSPFISEFLALNDDGLTDEDGATSDWIEITNPSATPVSLLGYTLTDDQADLTKWSFGDVVLPAGGRIVVFASGKNRPDPGSELHTDFSLDDRGEFLALVAPGGTTVASGFGAGYPPQEEDVSYGRRPGSPAGAYFLEPTPGAENPPTGVEGFVADTQFSHDRGFYEEEFELAITSNTPGAEIRYTLDGTAPTANTGRHYDGPITVRSTSIVRAAAYKPGFVPTNVDAHTYVFTDDVIRNRNMDRDITRDSTYAPLMDASLRAIPVVSVGFPGELDRTEREGSVEFFNFPDGDTQANCGIEQFGGFFRDFGKPGLRVIFRGRYGTNRLRFPVFAGQEYTTFPPAGTYDAFDIRAGNHDMFQRGAYMSNRFVDDSMDEMGHIAPHGRFIHLYVNGVYSGQYHLRERWNAAMLSEYFGGRTSDYEAINANNIGPEFRTGAVYDGSGDQWTETQNLLAGTAPFANVQSHLDVPNVVDFMLLWLSGRAESEFRAAGSPDTGVPFKFFMKDADGFLRNTVHPVDHNGPLNAMTTLFNEGDANYRILLADRIHKHFFNGGALTPERNTERLRRRMDEIRLSFISESARRSFRTPVEWENFLNNVINNIFPTLTSEMVDRFRAAGMYPDTVAPSFAQHGGAFTPGSTVAISAPAGTIYYTTDGSDPRASSTITPGAVSGSAIEYTGPVALGSEIVLRARVLDSENNWSAMNEATFFPDLSPLVVSEIMYRPPPATQAERDAGHTDREDFEYIEIFNTADTPLDLMGMTFSGAVTFDFSLADRTVLAPGERALVVRDRDAFAARYGTLPGVIGDYTGRLKNEGEDFRFSSATGRAIHSFTYDNASPWPLAAARSGSPLVLAEPETSPNHSLPESWRSGLPGGLPGGTTETYAVWAAENGVGAPGLDDDQDGSGNLLEFLLVTDPNTPDSPSSRLVSTVSNEFITLEVNHSSSAVGFTLTGETSTDLFDWTPVPVMETTVHGDGTATSTIRAPRSSGTGYIRARFVGTE